MQRFVSIWFPYLLSDWMVRRKPQLRDECFVFVTSDRGKRVVVATSPAAASQGISAGMVVADCKALVPDLMLIEFEEDRPQKILHALAEWCIRFTPVVSVDNSGGLLFDASGCAQLWGGEHQYLSEIRHRFRVFGYDIRIAMADSVGAAWALSHYGESGTVATANDLIKLLSPLPADALRIDATVSEKLRRLGCTTIDSFLKMSGTALRRRFGQQLLTRLNQALGNEFEFLEPVREPSPYEERLPCLEPIRTAAGIEIAISRLIDPVCDRLQREAKGLRKCRLTCYRVDGGTASVEISTSGPSSSRAHLNGLFRHRIAQIEPGLGIELFVMEALVVEEQRHAQDALWKATADNGVLIAELVDRITGRNSRNSVQRFLPVEHYWPERSVQAVTSLTTEPQTAWNSARPRPVNLFSQPQEIEVSVPLPDYPPLLFRHQGVLHQIQKADGPERIEQEWWIEQGLYRDYYCVEDDTGARYWIFRAGDYGKDEVKWYLHGFFA